jgi:alpha-tubulin suppressor-like RCC1 family protein
MALARKTFTANGTWTAPAGVNFATVIGQPTLTPIVFNPNVTNAIICNDGAVYTWGYGAIGTLGNGGSVAVSQPVAVLNSVTTSFNQLFAGFDAGTPCFIGINNAGDAYFWGGTANGEGGIGSVVSTSSPVPVLGGLKWSSISINGSSGLGQLTLGLTMAGVAYGWGNNLNGILGIGNATPQSSPVAVLGGLTFKQLIAGYNTAIGLTTAGAAYCWGLNTSGQLGNGNVTTSSSPQAVLGGLTFVSVAVDQQSVSASTTCFGLTAAGALYAWGVNTSGQLGVGDVNPRSSPVLVLGGLTWKSVTVVNGCVLGLTTAGVAYGWGSNFVGVIGNGNITPQSSPVAVLGGLTFSQLLLNPVANFALGLTTAGAAYGWGANANGQLGTGDVTARSSPVAVLGGLSFSQLVIGTSINSSYGITTSPTAQVYAWGANTYGNLGTNDVTPRSSPVAVLGGHLPNQAPPQTIKRLAVVPGTAYAITLQNGIGYFGSTQIAPALSQMIVEFEQ